MSKPRTSSEAYTNKLEKKKLRRHYTSNVHMDSAFVDSNDSTKKIGKPYVTYL